MTYRGDEWDQEPLQVILMPHSHNDPGWIWTVTGYFQAYTQGILDTVVALLSEVGGERGGGGGGDGTRAPQHKALLIMQCIMSCDEVVIQEVCEMVAGQALNLKGRKAVAVFLPLLRAPPLRRSKAVCSAVPNRHTVLPVPSPTLPVWKDGWVQVARAAKLVAISAHAADHWPTMLRSGSLPSLACRSSLKSRQIKY